MKLKEVIKGQKVYFYFGGEKIESTEVKNITPKGAVRLTDGTLLKDDTEHYSLTILKEWENAVINFNEEKKKEKEKRILISEFREKVEKIQTYYAHNFDSETIQQGIDFVDKILELGFKREKSWY